jgi:lysophospholipase L1-like esterase
MRKKLFIAVVGLMVVASVGIFLTAVLTNKEPDPENRYKNMGSSAGISVSRSCIFLGNSITAGFDLHVFRRLAMVNEGVGGDFTSDVLRRLPKILDRNPARIFLMIGINDLLGGVPFSNIRRHYEKIITLIQSKSPETKLFIQSVLPTRLDSAFGINNEDAMAKIGKLNTFLESYCKNNKLDFINLYPYFLGPDGRLDSALTTDGLHLSSAGYQLWYEKVKNYVEN